MTHNLIDRLRDERVSTLTIGHMTFMIKRPTDIDMAKLHTEGKTLYDVAEISVIGWEGVKESDIISDGSDALVKFDEGLFREWIKDQYDLWEPIRNKAIEAYEKHIEKREDAKKNSSTG